MASPTEEEPPPPPAAAPPPAFAALLALGARPAFGAPLSAWAQLALAVLAVSTAGVAFGALPAVPPLALASWRMQSTSAILAVGAWRDASRADAELLARWRASAPSLAASGACLGAHFGAWVAGLQNTSLAHSLLLVCCTPLLLALGALAMGFDVSRGEVAGAALGVAGVALVATDAGSSSGASSGVTRAGDVLSLGGAAFIVGYMLVGHKLRAWMPLFMYAFPVTLVAAVALALASLIAREDVIIFFAANDRGRDDATPPPRVVLGWLLGGDWRTFLVVSYLAVGPGLVGHTGYNAVLKHVSPLVVSVSLTLEPLLGTVLGYAAGVADAPGWRTAIGGAAMTVAVAVVVVAEANRKRRNDHT